MPPAFRKIRYGSTSFPAVEPPEPLTVDSDVVVILASLLCALICVVGLALVARCAWLRRSLGGAAAHPPPPNKGLNKKALRSLPKTLFNGAVAAECPICLTEFVQGDEIRVLPQCGHGFHVSCVDMWLRSHSSCPSCRQILFRAAPSGPSRCDRCGTSSAPGFDVPRARPSTVVSTESDASAPENGDINRFLP